MKNKEIILFENKNKNKNKKYEKYIDQVSGKELKKEINFYGNGKIHRKYFYLNNKQHREDGPAFIYYDGDGNIVREIYYLNDMCHREDAPAELWYDEDGNIEYEYFYLNGIECDNL